jgi:uncharacterized protein YndB with AHSA1/START domain
VLKDAGLVVDEPAGSRRIYRVDPDGMAAFRAQLDSFWSRTLAAFKQSAQQIDVGGVMTTQADQATVRTHIVVDAPIEHAFAVFTGRFGDFKPPEHNILGTELAETVFEPRAGGHIYDRAVDGRECRWARVLVYEPPVRVVFSWDLGPSWQVEADPAKTSEVEVRFIAETPERTRVELEHRHIDRHGDDWRAVADGVGSDAGWPLYLRRFAGLLDQEG